MWCGRNSSFGWYKITGWLYSARVRGNVSTVLAGVGVVAVGTGVVIWFVGRRRGAGSQLRSSDEHAAVRVVPLVASNVIGLTAGGVW